MTFSSNGSPGIGIPLNMNDCLMLHISRSTVLLKRSGERLHPGPTGAYTQPQSASRPGCALHMLYLPAASGSPSYQVVLYTPQ
jgi:hypothetical protein